MRRLVAETTLSPHDLVAPLFVGEGFDEPRAITPCPASFSTPSIR